MTLLDLLKTCDHKMRVRIHFGHESQFFDINADQKEAFSNWLEWMDVYKSVEDYYNGDVEAWNVQNITFTEWDKKGNKIETIERVLFVKMY